MRSYPEVTCPNHQVSLSPPIFLLPRNHSLDMAFHKANLARCSWERWLWVYEDRLSSSLGTITRLEATSSGDVGHDLKSQKSS